eukprot:1161508-Pelagomonas_calceolata.AAC.12
MGGDMVLIKRYDSLYTYTDKDCRLTLPPPPQNELCACPSHIVPATLPCTCSSPIVQPCSSRHSSPCPCHIAPAAGAGHVCCCGKADSAGGSPSPMV